MSSPKVHHLDTLWIEDSRNFIKNAVEFFANHIDDSIEIEDNPTIGLEQIKNHLSRYSSFIIDLDLNNNNIDGLVLAKEIIAQNKAVTVNILSANLSKNEWIERIEQFERNNDIKLNKIVKKGALIDKDDLPFEIEFMLSEKLKFEKIMQNPFKLSIGEMHSLSHWQGIAAHLKVQSLLADKVEELFADNSEEWVALAELDEKIQIVGFGAEDRIINDQFIFDLEEVYKTSVFIFKRPKFIEELPVPNRLDTGWSRTHFPLDFYPTIEFGFNGIRFKGHFDTGNPYSVFIDHQILRKGGFVATRWLNSQVKIFGHHYLFQQENESFEIFNNANENITVNVKFEAVLDWAKVFCQVYQRDCFIGRSFAAANGLTINLDWETKTTNIVKKSK